MTSIAAFGSWLPARVISNSELASRLDCTPEWILEMSGIEERRYASPDEDVVAMAVGAAKDCLERARCAASEVRLLIVSSASAAQRFPGPAAAVAAQLAWARRRQSTCRWPAPAACSASSWQRSLPPPPVRSLWWPPRRCPAPLSSSPRTRPPRFCSATARARAWCAKSGPAACCRLAARLGWHVRGRSAAAARRAGGDERPVGDHAGVAQDSRAITEVLARVGVGARDVEAFIMHQANQNLMDRVAKAVGAPPERFYSNIRRYGNTSSASMLIAAAEWAGATALRPGHRCVSRPSAPASTGARCWRWRNNTPQKKHRRLMTAF